MASHIPINHRLQPLYRFLSALAGVYVIVFGIVGVIRTSGQPFFDQRSNSTVFGLKENMAFAILSIVVGVIVLGGAAIGGNLDRFINLVGGIIFLGAGMLMMALLQTNANFLNFQMATCIVSFLIGIVLFTAGLYGKVGSDEEVAREEQFRVHRGPDPEGHTQGEQQAPQPAPREASAHG
jgi:hypothetical protein